MARARGVRAAEEDTAGARPRLRALAVSAPTSLPFGAAQQDRAVQGQAVGHGHLRREDATHVEGAVERHAAQGVALLTAVRTLPPLVVIVPPMMVPPATFHPPVRLSSARVLPVLSRVPVTFTVPPVRLNEPAGAGAKMPRPAVVNDRPG